MIFDSPFTTPYLTHIINAADGVGFRFFFLFNYTFRDFRLLYRNTGNASSSRLP